MNPVATNASPVSSEAPSVPPIAAPAPDCEAIFAAPAGGRLLCDEHVMATDSEIHWRSYALTTPRAEVTQGLLRRAGPCGFGVVTKPPLFSLSRGESRLSVHERTDTSMPSCSEKPTDHEASVVVISKRAAR